MFLFLFSVCVSLATKMSDKAFLENLNLNISQDKVHSI